MPPSADHPRMRGPIAGLILAGGRGQRMGFDKSLAILAGAPLVAHVAARLEPQVERIVVNANAEASRFDFLRHEVVADSVPDYAGPLAGILAGLHWAEANGYDRIVSVATDTPFFPVDLVSRLDEAADGDAIVLAACQSRPHPVFALWPSAVANAIDAFLRSGEKASVLGMIKAQPHRFVDFDPVLFGTTPQDPFFNINTPADLELAERLVTELPS